MTRITLCVRGCTLLWLFSLGCKRGEPAAPAVDEDEDGSALGIDCNDKDENVFPGNVELCDGKDNDCDENTTDPTVSSYTDEDGDAFGAGDPVEDCLGLGAAVDGDCDDGDPTVNPDAEEDCDPVDRNCDGDPVAGAPAAATWYADTDFDGFGDEDAPQTACEQPVGFVSNADDCDDQGKYVYPGADEYCDDLDNDCDNMVDEADEPIDAPTWYLDSDGDGYGDENTDPKVQCDPPRNDWIEVAESDPDLDCNDANEDVHPNAEEECDGIDNDCDGKEDEAGGDPWYPDVDEDGFGDEDATAVRSCDEVDGHVANKDDCDDADPEAYPEAPERCNEADDDCDGVADDKPTGPSATWYLDADGDGYGEETVVATQCTPPQNGAQEGGDCDDGAKKVHPGADELCNGIDDDCDPFTIDDDSADATPWYLDEDGDGYGDDTVTYACEAPADHASKDGDCAPDDTNVNPGEDEVCNGGIDDDCDEDTLEDALDGTVWYTDGDGDGHGDGVAATACEQPANTSADDDDCDDLAITTYEGASELCNSGVDDDCDPATVDDDSDDATTWYVDADGDGHGDPNGASVVACLQPEFTTDAEHADDCDDELPNVHPEHAELCNGIDDDCDPLTPEDQAADDTIEWWFDDDGDGWGGDVESAKACFEAPENYAQPGDCEDDVYEINPDAPDICNGGIDDDCDPLTDEEDGDSTSRWYDDSGDYDGYGDDTVYVDVCNPPDNTWVLLGGDCALTDDQINPGMTDVCNDGVDDDCDSETDEDEVSGSTWYYDYDGDGYGSSEPTESGCTQPDGYTAEAGDCQDDDEDRNPGEEEICADWEDNDCNQQIDEGCYVDHCGAIATAQVWTADFVHRVTCDITVEGDADPSLMILAGAQVVFSSGTGITVGNTKKGRLIVAEGPVTFTAHAEQPAAGFWDGLWFGAKDSGSTLTGVTVEFGGAQSQAAVRVNGAALSMTGSVVRKNANDGIHVASGSINVSSTELSDNTGTGLRIDPTAVLSGTAGGLVVTGNGMEAMNLPANYARLIDPTGSDFTGNTLDVVALYADQVDTSGTWAAIGVPWRIRGDIDVYGNTLPELTIAPGNTLEFESGAGLVVGYSGSGKLVAPGGGEVRFTSAKSQPAALDWDGLTFGASDLGSSLAEVVVEYGGANYYGGVYVNGSKPSFSACDVSRNGNDGFNVASTAEVSIAGCTIANNADYGVYMASTARLAPGSDPAVRTFSGNTVTGNVYAMAVSTESVGEIGSDSHFAGNTWSRVELLGGTVTQTATWEALDVPYLANVDLTVQGPADPTLTLPDGVVVRFATSASLTVGSGDDGKLVVEGDVDEGAGVVFTSNASLPAANDWDGVTVGAKDLGSSLTGLTIEYGGANGTAGLYLNGGTPAVSASTIRNNAKAGIYVNGKPRIEDCLVEGNLGNGVDISTSGGLDRADAATRTFSGNTIRANTGQPLILPVNYTDEVDATNVLSGNTIDKLGVRGGTIDIDTTWHALDVPWQVQGDVTVQHATAPMLTVKDGVVVRWANSAGLSIGTSYLGLLDVQGTTDGVLFTSDSLTPSPGIWDGVALNQYSDGSTLVGLTIRYGGGSQAGLYANNTDVELDGCSFLDNAGGGIKAVGSVLEIDFCTIDGNLGDGLNADSSSQILSFSTNVVTDNTLYAATLPANYAWALEDTSTFTGNANNQVVLTADDVDTSGTWSDLGIPYLVTGDIYVRGAGNPILTIASGVEIRFSGTGTELIVGTTAKGGLVVAGDALFTSANTLPGPGNWSGVEFGTNDLGSNLDGLVIEYAGYNGKGNLYVNGATLTKLRNVTSRESSYNGLQAAGAAVLDIQDSTFSDNERAGILMDTTSTLLTTNGPTFKNNVLTGNSGASIEMAAATIDQLHSSSTFSGNGDYIRINGGTVTRTGSWACHAGYRIVDDFGIGASTAPRLTIPDGCRFYADSGKEVKVGMTAGGTVTSGTLQVNGDLDLGTGVLFTSSASTKARGDWDGIEFSTLSGSSVLRGTTVEYGGGGNNSGSVYANGCPDLQIYDSTLRWSTLPGLEASSGTVLIAQDSSFTDNAGDGLRLASGAKLGGADGSFARNTMTRNGGYAISLDAKSVTKLDKTSSYTGNTTNAVQVIGGTADTSGTWQKLNAPYRVSADLNINGTNDPTITIEGGTTMQFDANADFYVATSSDEGKLVVDGGLSAVVFTSSKTTKAAGDWGGVEFRSKDMGSVLTGLEVAYAGQNGKGGLYLNSAPSVTVTGGNIHHSSWDGIWVYNGTLTMATSTVANNARSGVYLTTSGFADISGSTLSNNAFDGLNVDDSSGLVLGGSSDDTFDDNVVTANGDRPIELPAKYAGELAVSSTYTGNTVDVVLLLADTVDIDSTWHDLGVPYQVTGNVNVQKNGSTAKLVVEDGVEARFQTGAGLNVGPSYPGTLDVQGDTLGVLFTSSQTVKKAGDWAGVVLDYYSDGSSLTGLTIEYAGSTNVAGLDLYYTTADLTDITVRNCNGDGISARNSTFDLVGATLTNNKLYAIDADSNCVIGTLDGVTATGHTTPAQLPANYAGALGANTWGTNTDNRIWLVGSAVDHDAIWSDQGPPYYATAYIDLQGDTQPTLTINSGVEVQFNTNLNLRVGYSKAGKLLVNGTALNPVTFTSAKATKNPGDWKGIEFYSGDKGSVLDNLVIEYGGSNGYGNLWVGYASINVKIIASDSSWSSKSGLYVDSGTVDVTGSTFANNVDNGVTLASSTSYLADGLGVTRTFKNNTMTDNGLGPISLPPPSVRELDTSSSYDGNGDRIRIIGGTVAKTGTWKALDEDYRLMGKVDVVGATDPILTIEDGTAFYADASGEFYVSDSSDDGQLLVLGTRQNGVEGVLFTSSAAVPTRGSWRGFTFAQKSGGSRVEGAEIAYAGTNTYGALYTFGSTLTVSDCDVRESSKHGVYGGSSAVLAVDGSYLRDNNDSGLYLASSSYLTRVGQPSFVGNEVTGNAGSPVVIGPDSLIQLDKSSQFKNDDGSGQRIEVQVGSGREADWSGTWQKLDQTVWFAGDVNIEGPQNPVITVEDGASFVFSAPSYDLCVGCNDDGRLVVAGGGTGVTMSSSKPANQKAPGDWGGLEIGRYDMSPGSSLTNLTLDYAGGNGEGNIHKNSNSTTLLTLDGVISRNSSTDGLEVDGGTVAVSSSIFEDNLLRGVSIETYGLLDATQGAPSFSGNVLTGNTGVPLYVPAESLAQIEDDCDFTGNIGSNEIYVPGGTVSTSGTWQKQNVPYVVYSDLSIYGPTDPVVTVDPGVVMKFGAGVDLLVGQSDDGSIRVLGTAAEPVRFTTSNPSPAPGTWPGLTLGGSCIDSGGDASKYTVIDYAVIEYGGGSGYNGSQGNLYITSCGPTVSNTTVAYSGSWGIKCSGTFPPNPTRTNITYDSNTSGTVTGCP